MIWGFSLHSILTLIIIFIKIFSIYHVFSFAPSLYLCFPAAKSITIFFLCLIQTSRVFSSFSIIKEQSFASILFRYLSFPLTTTPLLEKHPHQEIFLGERKGEDMCPVTFVSKSESGWKSWKRNQVLPRFQPQDGFWKTKRKYSSCMYQMI